MKLKGCILILLLVSLINTIPRAENIKTRDTTKVNNVRLSARLNKNILIYQDTSRKINSAQLISLNFSDTFPLQLKVSPKMVESDVYLKFTVANTADSTVGFSFFPGIYFDEMKLYQIDSGGISVLQTAQYPGEINGFKKLKLASHETVTYFAKLRFVKTNTHTFSPMLIRDYFVNSYFINYQNEDKSGNTLTFVFSGVLLMMIFYSLAVFALNGNVEFIYYGGYAFFLGLMLFLKAYFFRVPCTFTNFFEAYLDFVMQSAGTFIYLAFLKTFIDSKKKFPWLNKLFTIEQCLIVVSIGIFSYLHFGTNHFVWQNMLEGVSKYLWVVGAVIFVIYTINKKNTILYYLAWAHTALIAGGLVSLYLIVAPGGAGFRHRNPGAVGNALTYYELGLAIELMVFLLALALKNKTDLIDRTKEGERLKLLTERQDLEKQVAILMAQQDERNRISADMHDELGSGATHIRLMSEIIKAKMTDKALPELDKISNSANELIIKMNTLIWTMKSDNDSVESLVTYIRIYALEFFENTFIDCDIEIPPAIPNIELTGEKRRNLFLTVKESLNNILKHSKADKVVISFQINKKLLITIIDNGIGIDVNNLRRFGSGLGNMKKRIEGIEGIYNIDNNPGGGAKTILELKL